jgi:hypothetical protein
MTAPESRERRSADDWVRIAGEMVKIVDVLALRPYRTHTSHTPR